MPEDDKDVSPTGDESDIVDQLLSDLGVDEEMRRELVESGRVSGDIFKVEPAEQVRRRLEMEKSIERIQTSVAQVERAFTSIDESIDKIERDLIPVVLTFLVNLKGNLVNLRTTIIGRSKRKAKTNLQETYVEQVVAPVTEEEFSKIENTLTSGMATPIMDRVREINDTLKDTLREAMEALASLKASIDDYTQKSATELEFLTKELSMKPRLEIPHETQEKMKLMQRRLEELERDLKLTRQVLENRENEIEDLKSELDNARVIIEAQEGTITALRARPGVDGGQIMELRQHITSLEASRDVLKQKLDDTIRELEEARVKTRDALAQVSKKDLECEDLRTKVTQAEQEIARLRERLGEIDSMKARLREYESGEKVRELERIKSDYERIRAANERLQKEHAAMKAELESTTRRLESYLDLMASTEKTKAFLMLEETGQMTTREIGRSLGISPAQVTKWAEDFERLGIAKVEGDTIVLTRDSQGSSEESE